MKYKTLRDVPLRNYQRLQNKKDHNNYDIMSILFGYKTTEINKAKQKDIDLLILHLKDQLEKDNELTNILEIDGIEYGFIPNLDDISYGENTDITNYVSDWSTMHKAMAVMYRPIIMRKKDRYIIEDYEGSDKYSEIMKDAPLDVVLGCLVFFLQFNERIVELYPELFATIGEKRGFDTSGGFGTKWGRYSELHTLSQGDIRRFKEISKLGLFQCLTYLAYEKDKMMEEQRQFKKIKKNGR